MKVLHLSTFDRINGASIAAYRLHRSLIESGVNSAMWVQNKVTSDPTVFGPRKGAGKYWSLARPWLDRMALLPAKAFRDSYSSPSWLPRWDLGPMKEWKPDVIHLHWVQGGFVPIGLLPKLATHMGRSIPVCWTFHDEWAFSGLRHYPPFPREENLSSLYQRWEEKIRARKTKSYEGLNLTAVAPSRWMAERAQASSVWSGHQTEVLPNPIDTSVFHPVDRQVARRLLKLPQDQRLVLFGSEAGAGDPRKGFDLLRQACRTLADSGNRFGLVCFGNGSPGDLGDIPCHSLGWLHDDASLALAYSAADIVVLPSRQDNLPNTGVEALACGRPVVTFAIGGIPDIVDDGESGFLCPEEDAVALEGAIRKLLEDYDLRIRMGKTARESAERRFSTEVVVPSFIELYKGLIG
ncbi:glycosyltransferase [Puniceicoccus vermicola]|uniref:Glycosyltransferase n=1 Tax=Puniceicoccus vermicola TaxID=388746 RepID=A0A7X1AW57_9BACT|nr:glycosyltransferase [Puniceicoccus vermicola]MBC2601103.1 glycosyltransferase [Puniceicoccus vermicola]